MTKEDASLQLRLKIDEARNYLLEEIKCNELINKKHKKTCRYSNVMLIVIHHLILIIAKIIFQCQVKVRLMVLMEALVLQKKNFVINSSKANRKFCLSLHYNGDNSYLFVNETKIFKFESDNKNVNFPNPLLLRQHIYGGLEVPL